MFEVSCARSVIKYFFRSRGDRDLLFNYLVSFDLINIFQKGGLEQLRKVNRPFPSSPGPLYQKEVKCSAFDMEMIFHSHA